MKKIFSFLLLVLLSIGTMWADTKTYSFTSSDELNNLTYTAGDASDAWGVQTAKANNVEPRAGGFLQYKCGKSGKTATFVTKESLNEISNISFYIASSDKGKTQLKIEVSSQADFSSDITEIVNATGGLTDLGISSPANNTWYPVSQNVASKSGYVRFTMTASSSGKFWSFDDIVITYTPAATYTVTYKANNGTAEADVVETSATISDCPNTFTTPTDKAFAGWNTSADGTGTPYAVGATVPSNLTLYAQWENIYTVTYNPNGATGEPFVDNNAVAIAANMFTTPDGKRFTGWNTAADGTGTNYAVDADVTSNLTLYAQWATIYGEIVTYTMETGSGNIDKDITAGGIVGATGHQKSQKSGKLGSNGHYLSLTINQGKFQVGDTVKISVTPEYNSEKETYSFPGTLKLSSDLDNTDFIGQATLPVDPSSSATVVFNIVLTKEVNTIYLSRNTTFSQNPIVASVIVVRPVPEKSRSAAEITSVEIDNVALDAASLSTLKTNHSFASVEEYVEAPAVKFFTSVTVTYEDDSQKVIDEEIVANVTEDPVGTWKAVANINEVNYIITAVKPTSYTVTYKYGETVIGDELVAAGGHPTEYAAAQSMQLASFNGWFSDAELTSPVDPAAAVINANTEFYASFTLLFASSVNIEAYALRNGKSEANTNALIAQMGAQHYASNFAYDAGNNEIDYLNDSKDTRNYAYLGLKIKSAGTMLNFRVASGNTVKVKFGNVATAPKVSINGGDYENMVIADHVYSYTAVADALVSIKTADAKAVVLQQIAIGEELAASEYEVEITLGENGYSTFATDYKYTVEGAEVYKAAYNGSNAVTLTEVVDAVVPANAGIILKGTAGEIVTLTASGSAATELADNGLVGVVAPLAATEGMYVLSTNAGVTEFNPCQAGVMIPAHKAYISIPSNAPAVRIIFAENGATGINELEGAEKAVKFIENGKLYIQKDGVVYDATGAKVK